MDELQKDLQEATEAMLCGPKPVAVPPPAPAGEAWSATLSNICMRSIADSGADPFAGASLFEGMTLLNSDTAGQPGPSQPGLHGSDQSSAPQGPNQAPKAGGATTSAAPLGVGR